jgi:hypothetical protein
MRTSPHEEAFGAPQKDEMRRWARSPEGDRLRPSREREMSFRMRSTRIATTAGLVRLLCALGLVAGLMAAFATGASAKKVAEVEIVTQGSFPEPSEIPANVHYFHKIQEGVAASGKGAWVLIEPGVYNEEVKVKGKAHEGLHIRGMNRNTVILDGTGLVKSARPNTKSPNSSTTCGSKTSRSATSNRK